MVGCRRQLDKTKLKSGTRVALDMTTLTIMRYLPREVDPLVYNMSHEDPGNVSYAEIGGLQEQIRELREVVELPLLNPELFLRVGITPPKGCLLYGPPGTGKTLLARAVASQLDCSFLKVVSSAIVDKYIGESARMIREMFAYAKDHEPCIIFMDEIDAIGNYIQYNNKKSIIVLIASFYSILNYKLQSIRIFKRTYICKTLIDLKNHARYNIIHNFTKS